MNRGELERNLEAIHLSCFGWAMTCCRWNREEAEEVLQTAYLRVLDGTARFNSLSSLRTWFFGVVRNTARERYRRSLTRTFGLDRLFRDRPAAEPIRTPETLSRDAEDRKRLRKLLGSLPPRQKEMLHLVFYEELTIEQAATVLGVALGTARRHYQRGKDRIRKQLMSAEKSHGKKGRDREATSRTVCGG